MKKMMVLLALVVLFGSSFFGNFIFNAMANEPSAQKADHYYKSIVIEQGDSLWSIAQEYSMDTDMDTQEYITKLKQMNGLKEDTIHAGRHITVMYRADVR